MEFEVGDKVRIKPEGWIGELRKVEISDSGTFAVVYVVAGQNGPDVRMSALIHGILLKDLEPA